MEWQQLLGFYHLARLGSFTRAADATFRTQSALSQQIKALEGELGLELVERIGKRQVRLTAAGRTFYQCAAAILERYENFLEELQVLKGLPHGELRLAAPFTTLYHLFREVLTDYAKQFPQVQLTVLDRSQREVIDLVKKGDIDFGVALESRAPKELEVRRWQQVETVLMVPLDHPLARAPKVTLREIARYPLILPPREHTAAGRRVLEEMLDRHGLDYHVIMESSNVELSSLYVELGLGISFATVVKDRPLTPQRQVKFISLHRWVKPDHIAVIMRKNKFLSPYKQALVEMLLGDTG